MERAKNDIEEKREAEERLARIRFTCHWIMGQDYSKPLPFGDDRSQN